MLRIEVLEMLNKLNAALKLASILAKNKVISPKEYAESYNSIHETYSSWNSVMGKYTIELIEKEIPEKNETILDFACGNGFLSKHLFKLNEETKIIGVDISEKLIEKCLLENNKIKYITLDGIEYLEEIAKLPEKEKLDRIYTAWALPYFNNDKLIKLFTAALKKDGLVFLISNSKNTLKNLDKVYRDVIMKHPKNLKKIMKISSNIPNGKLGLQKLFEKNGFKVLDIDEGEEIVRKTTALELYNWLKKSGVSAGTEKMFEMNDEIKKSIVEAMEKRLYYDNTYNINHKFVRGIFKKE